MNNISWICLAVAAVCMFELNLATFIVRSKEWAEYKAKFNKDYTSSPIPEGYARYFYAYNKMMIDLHNLKFERGSTSFKLAINEHTDRRFIHFSAGFPLVALTGPSFDSPPPTVQAAAPSYDPINDFGFVPNIENQGTVCNSGWAYSVAKSIEMLQSQQTGNMRPVSLSAQNLIDCAGRGTACTKQVPQTAFDYLTKYNMDLHLTSDYPNNNTLNQQNMCAPQGDLVVNLSKYARLTNGDNASLMAYVSNGYAVVVEINPCLFEFMHYSTGVYQQPASLLKCSHFVVVIGYGTDATTGMDYWLVQNSFGTFWGEKGLMRIQRTPSKQVFKNAVFPTEFA